MTVPLLRPVLVEKDPRAWRRAAEARLELLHDEMQAILATLDALDGDTDLEPSICGGVSPGGVSVTDDREGGDVLDEGEANDWDDEHNGDDEPSLGWSHHAEGGLPLGWSYHPMRAAGCDHEE